MTIDTLIPLLVILPIAGFAVTALIGRRLGSGERFDTHNLINQDFHVTVVNVEKDGRTYDNVVSVNVIRRAKAAKAEELKADEGDEGTGRVRGGLCVQRPRSALRPLPTPTVSASPLMPERQ